MWVDMLAVAALIRGLALSDATKELKERRLDEHEIKAEFLKLNDEARTRIASGEALQYAFTTLIHAVGPRMMQAIFESQAPAAPTVVPESPFINKVLHG